MLQAAPLAERFESHVVSNSLLEPDQKIVIGVSGGADSVALLHLLLQLRGKMRLTLLAVHINHNLRGEESQTDEQFVRNLCSTLSIPLVVRQVRFEGKTGLENQARAKRRQILTQVLDSYKFDRIALAHQKNDQAETVLMNLLRGAGITGLGGIRAVSGKFIRPLLPFTKAEIEQWMRDNHHQWRTDSSNQDSTFTRNRIRHELLSMLQDSFHPQVMEHLAEQAGIFQQADGWLMQHCARLLKKLTLDETDDMTTLDLRRLKAMTELEQFYCLRSVYARLSGTQQEFFRHSFAEIGKILRGEGCRQTSLAHGIRVYRQYDELIFSTKDLDKASEEAKELTLDEERTHFAFQNWRFTLKYLKLLPHDYATPVDRLSVCIDLNKVTLPLTLRLRQPGDRFVPLGMQSEKKLKEFFIDEKVPRTERDKVPILTDVEKIVWVVGYRLDNRVLCSPDTHRILHITLEPVTAGRKRSANRFNNNTGEKHALNE